MGYFLKALLTLMVGSVILFLVLAIGVIAFDAFFGFLCIGTPIATFSMLLMIFYDIDRLRDQLK